MAQEIELKFCPPPGLSGKELFDDRDIAPWCGAIERISMHTEYLDTRACDAKRSGITLRRRFENGKSVIYAKNGKASSGALSVRGEWSVVSEDIENAAMLLADAGAPTQFLSGIPLEVVGSVRFQRLEALVSPWEGFSFMLSFDEGFFREKEPFSEVELELVCGSCEELAVFGERLAEKYHMKPELRSKYARAIGK